MNQQTPTMEYPAKTSSSPFADNRPIPETNEPLLLDEPKSTDNRKLFAKEVQFVEFVNRYLWNSLRHIFKKHISRRCKKCILSEAYTTLNDQGICPECESYNPAQSNDQTTDPEEIKKLEQILQQHQQKGAADYDALMLFSGGKDSSYLLYKLATEYPGLRVLTVMVDSGFMSPFALDNARRVLNKINVPHLTIRPKPTFVRKAFRHALKNTKHQKGYTIVDLMDAHIIFDTARNLAAKMNIPLVLSGLSKVQTKNIFGFEGIEFPLEVQKKSPVKFAGMNLKDIFTDEEMNNLWDGAKWPENRIPRFVLPYCAWKPEETFIRNEVVRLGLLDKNQITPLLTNNALIPLIGLTEVAHFGYCSWEVEFAEMVRTGKSDRIYWRNIFEMLEVSAKSGRFVNKSADITMAQLGITRQDLGLQKFR